MMMLPLLLLALAWPSERQLPAAPGEFQLGAVSVTGVSRYAAADVTRLTALKSGQPVRLSDLDATVKQMSSTGLFASLKYRYVTSGHRLDVTFDIEEPAVVDAGSLRQLCLAARRGTVRRGQAGGADVRRHAATITGVSDQDADTLRKKWTLKAGEIYDDAYIQQFRKENATPTRRLTLEPAIDAARQVVDLKLVATAR